MTYGFPKRDRTPDVMLFDELAYCGESLLSSRSFICYECTCLSRMDASKQRGVVTACDKMLCVLL